MSISICCQRSCRLSPRRSRWPRPRACCGRPMAAAEIAHALKGRRSGKGFIARCVAHEDRSPSLSIADGTDGRVLVKCHAGCDQLDVLAALRRLNLLDNAERERPASRLAV